MPRAKNPLPQSHPVPSQSGVTKAEVELARIHEAADQRRTAEALRRERFRLLDTALRGLRIATWILAAAVPLQVIEHVTRDIAGKQTTFTGTLRISVAISVLVSIGWASSAGQSYRRKKKIKRLRERVDHLEARQLGEGPSYEEDE
jgi:hypothetical protein